MRTVIIVMLIGLAVIVETAFRHSAPAPNLPIPVTAPTSAPEPPLRQKISTPSSIPTPAKPTVISTKNWQLYQDKERGFSFLYPNGYFLKTTGEENLLFKISNSADFEKNEFSFVLRGYESPKPLPDRTNPYLKDMLERNLQLATVSSRLKVPVFAEFLGNPPYEGYEVSLPLKKNYLNINVVFNDENESRDTAIFSKILSTLKFLDQNSEGTFCGGIAGVKCQGNYTCKLDGKYPDAGGKCVKN